MDEILEIDDTFLHLSHYVYVGASMASRWISIGCWKKILSDTLVKQREKKSGPYRTLLNRILYLLPMSVVINERPNPNETWSECIQSLLGPLYLPMGVISCSWLCVPQLDAFLSLSLPSLLNSNKLSMRLECQYRSVLNSVALGEVWPICFWLPFLWMCWDFVDVTNRSNPKLWAAFCVKFEPIPWKASNPIDRFHFEQMIEWRKSNKNHAKSDRITSNRNTFTTTPTMTTATASMKWKEN